jgi:transposase
VRLYLKRRERLTRAQAGAIDRLCALDAAIAAAYRLAQDFGAMVRERQGERLDAWIGEAALADSRDLRRFALGLKDDPAIRAGLTETWSNGQTEGQVTRLKCLKRQGYGRAGFACLRRRILQAA